MCGALIEMGVWKVMMKRQTSWILSITAPVFFIQLELCCRWQYGAELTVAHEITRRRLGAPIGTIPIILNTSTQTNTYNPSKNSFNFPHTRGSPLSGAKQRWFDQ